MKAYEDVYNKHVYPAICFDNKTGDIVFWKCMFYHTGISRMTGKLPCQLYIATVYVNITWNFYLVYTSKHGWMVRRRTWEYMCFPMTHLDMICLRFLSVEIKIETRQQYGKLDRSMF